jgi:hypothetical protein
MAIASLKRLRETLEYSDLRLFEQLMDMKRLTEVLAASLSVHMLTSTVEQYDYFLTQSMLSLAMFCVSVRFPSMSISALTNRMVMRRFQ